MNTSIDTTFGRNRGINYFNICLFLTCFLLYNLFSCSSRSETKVEESVGLTDSKEAAENYADLAINKLYQEWDWVGAKEAFLKSLDLNPGLARSHAHYGWYLTLEGRYIDAVASMIRAREIEPETPLWAAWEGWMYLNNQDFKKATEAALRSLEMDSSFSVGFYVLGRIQAHQGLYEEAIDSYKKASIDPRWRFGLGYVYALSGRCVEARKIAAELAQVDNKLNHYGIAKIYIALREENTALQYLEKAYKQRHPYMPWFSIDPDFVPLHSHPQFQKMSERIPLPRDQELE